jgi:nitrogen regulatory protein PII
MNQVKAIIKPSKLKEVKDAQNEPGIESVTVTEVKGFGRQKGRPEIYRAGECTVDSLPKIKIEIVVADHFEGQVVNVIIRTARTGKIGEGKILVWPLAAAQRIRTGECDDKAV